MATTLSSRLASDYAASGPITTCVSCNCAGDLLKCVCCEERSHAKCGDRCVACGRYVCGAHIVLEERDPWCPLCASSVLLQRLERAVEVMYGS